MLFVHVKATAYYLAQECVREIVQGAVLAVAGNLVDEL